MFVCLFVLGRGQTRAQLFSSSAAGLARVEQAEGCCWSAPLPRLPCPPVAPETIPAIPPDRQNNFHFPCTDGGGGDRSEGELKVSGEIGLDDACVAAGAFIESGCAG